MESMYAIVFDDNSYLEHHGIEGMKWGIRRFQNEDGTLTEEGRKRYNKELMKRDPILSPNSWARKERRDIVSGTVAAGLGIKGLTEILSAQTIAAGMAAIHPLLGAGVTLGVGIYTLGNMAIGKAVADGLLKGAQSMDAEIEYYQEHKKVGKDDSIEIKTGTKAYNEAKKKKDEG